MQQRTFCEAPQLAEDIVFKKVAYTVSLGGFDTEPIDAFTVNSSPQLREIPKGTSLTIPVFKVPKSYIFRLKSSHYETFSNQALQDLVVRIFVANSVKFQSGKVDITDPAIYLPEARLEAETGAPYTKQTTLTGTGYVDNFQPQNDDNFTIAYEEETIQFRVENQSRVYNHWIKVFIGGWHFPMNGRSKDEIIQFLAGKSS